MNNSASTSSLRKHTNIPYRTELSRKFVHLLGLIIPVGVLWIGKTAVLYILAGGIIASLGAELLRVCSHMFNRLIERIFAPLMRLDERPSVGDPVVINGAIWMAIGAFLTFLIFPIPIAAGAFSMAVLGDTAAALIGRRYGRHSFGRQNKTIEGSLAFLGISLLAAAVLPELSLPIGAVGAAVATLAEAWSVSIYDNVTTPLSSGAAMLLLLSLM